MSRNLFPTCTDLDYGYVRMVSGNFIIARKEIFCLTFHVKSYTKTTLLITNWKIWKVWAPIWILGFSDYSKSSDFYLYWNFLWVEKMREKERKITWQVYKLYFIIDLAGGVFLFSFCFFFKDRHNIERVKVSVLQEYKCKILWLMIDSWQICSICGTTHNLPHFQRELVITLEMCINSF